MRHLWLIVLALVLGTEFGHAQQTTKTADEPVPSDQWAAKKITPPELLSSVEAEYPDDARIKSINGVCRISVIVDVQGNPQTPHIIHCTDSSFEESSLNAVRQFRFKPAVTQEGKPVAVTIYIQPQYRLIRYPFERKFIRKRSAVNEMSLPIRYGFIPLQGGASVPDSDGVYPFTRDVTGPRVIKFSDKGYGRVAFVHDGNSTCDVVLTISTKGKATDPQIKHCERPGLEKPAIESLLKSHYKPGMVNGKAVPMRASVHLEYGGDAAKP